MKTKKRRMEYLAFYNHTGIEQHLTDMAKKGWMIESITNFWWTYRKIEPKDIHFCVTYYPRASDFDPGPDAEQQTFHDFCAHTGWQLACTWFQMQVFYNEMPSPIPLETDPIMEVDTLHRAIRKNYLPSNFIILALSFLMTCYFIAGVCLDPIGLLSSSSRLVTQFAYLCLFAFSAVELVTYFTWLRKARREAQNRVFVDTPSTANFQKSMLAVVLIAMVYWFANLFAADDPLMVWIAIVMMSGLFGVMLLVNGIKQGLKKARASRGLNKALTLAACFILPMILTSAILYTGISMVRSERFGPDAAAQDSVPLSVADLVDVEQDDYVQTNDLHQTFFLGRMNVNAFPHWDVENRHEYPDLRYDVTIVKMPALYDWCKEEMYRDWDESGDSDIPDGHKAVYMPHDPAPWGAMEAYQLYQQEGWYLNWYLLCYEDRIVQIRFDWEPTPEQMAIVAEKLNP